MGDAADDAFDSWLAHEFDARYAKPVPYQRGTGRFMWRNYEGEILDMRSMTDAHLRNVAAYCRQHGNTGKLADIEQVLSEREPSGLADLRQRTGD